MADSLNMFMKEAGETSKAYMNMVMQLSQSSALDRKTQELAYIAVLAATKMAGGLGYHVKSVKGLGASREEVKSAVLVGLPAVGIAVAEALDIALKAFDGED